MAEKQSGPVKPPTLEMQARRTSPRTPSKPADASKSGGGGASASPANAYSGDPSTASARPASGPRPATSHPASPAFPLIPATLSAAVGAIVAILAVLGLATSGMLSALMPEQDGSQAERLTFAEEQVSEALVGFNALNTQVTDLQARLDSAATRSDNNDDLITSRQDELETLLADLPAPAEVPDLDLSGIEARIDQLDSRIAALRSGASSEQAESLSTELSDLRSDLTALSQQVTVLDTRVADLDTNLQVTSEGLLSEGEVITALQAQLADLQAEPALPSSDTQLLRLPLALSGLETALEAARPFSAELQSLLALVPDLSASGELMAAAETGLPAPGRIVTDFSRAVPALMAARPADPDAGIWDSLWSRAQALLAIRPTGETGDDPVIDTLARAEQAVADRQFTTAATALAALPAPMRQAAGETGEQIALMAEAQQLLSEARASVLAASAGEPTVTEDEAAE